MIDRRGRSLARSGAAGRFVVPAIARAVACALAATTVLAAASRAHAQPAPTDADRSTAQALFEAARKLTADRRWDEACPKLAESHRLDPSIGTEFYLADCYEQSGRLASAQVHYYEVVVRARAAGQNDRADFAKKRADALGPRVPRLIVIASDAAKRSAGLVVERDGTRITDVQLGVPIPVDPGKHVIVASATGKRWEATVELAKEGETATVTVGALRDVAGVSAPKLPAPRSAVATSPAPVPAAEPAASPFTPMRIAGIAVAGVGVVGIGVGAAFGAVAISKNAASKADGHCDAESVCDTTGKEARLAAFHASTASTIGFVVGGVALAGGVALIVVGRPSPRAQAALGVGPGRITLTGSW